MTPSLHRLRGGLIATAIALAAGYVMAEQAGQTAANAVATTAATQAAPQGVRAKAVAPGLYEVVYSPSAQAVFVASAGGAVRDRQSGAVYQLDARDLSVKKKIELPLKPFALALDDKTHTLYVGHTLDGAISAIDIRTGKLKGTLHHDVKDAEGKAVHTRQVVVDEAANKIYVTGITDGGFLWVIDGKDFKTERIIQKSDAPTAGLTLDAASHRVYVSGTAAYAAFDTHDWQQVARTSIPEKLQPGDARRRFLVNTALDDRTGRLFANQLNNGEGTLVLERDTGKLLHTIATGETPVGIRFNPIRNELYVASLGSGTVSVIDAGSYAIKHSLPVPDANSLALTPDGQVLYVTAKQGDKAQPLDKVLRIDLGKL